MVLFDNGRGSPLHIMVKLLCALRYTMHIYTDQVSYKARTSCFNAYENY